MEPLILSRSTAPLISINMQSRLLPLPKILSNYVELF